MANQDLPPEKLDYLMGVITATVPSFTRHFLEEHYEPLNHASNSHIRDHTFEQQLEQMR